MIKTLYHFQKKILYQFDIYIYPLNEEKTPPNYHENMDIPIFIVEENQLSLCPDKAGKPW